MSDGITISVIGRNAKVTVNGKKVVGTVPLHHNWRVIIGNNHVFRFVHPIEKNKRKLLKQNMRQIRKNEEERKEGEVGEGGVVGEVGEVGEGRRDIGRAWVVDRVVLGSSPERGRTCSPASRRTNRTPHPVDMNHICALASYRCSFRGKWAVFVPQQRGRPARSDASCTAR